MQKRLISLLLVVCMLVPLCCTAHAAESNAESLESEAAEHIEQIVSLHYYDFPELCEIGDAIPIYNADTACVYYIVPVFHEQECVATIELDAAGNVTMTDEVSIYTNITALLSPTYLLYTSGGIVYAELPGERIELYDSGFHIPQSNDFTLLSYADKVSATETCLAMAASNLDVAAVIEEVDFQSTAIPIVSMRTVVPSTESESCSITNFVTQDSYNICWAACVATIVNYKKGYDLTAVNVAAAMGHNYTSPYYTGGTAEETATALSSYGLTYRATASKLSWSDVKSNITNNRPFILGIVTSVGGHMLTGYGYTCQYGDAEEDADLRYIRVWDPKGAKRTLRYNATSYSIYGYSWSWIETVID